MAKVAKPAVASRPISAESARWPSASWLVMAWARDIETGEPGHIGGSDAEHCGGRCECGCPSCEMALISYATRSSALACQQISSPVYGRICKATRPRRARESDLRRQRAVMRLEVYRASLKGSRHHPKR